MLKSLIAAALLILPSIAWAQLPNQWHPYRCGTNAIQVIDNLNNFNCSPSSTIDPTTGAIVSLVTYGGANAFQAHEADLTITSATVGSSTDQSPVYIGSIMGNLLRTGIITSTSNIMGGVIGKYTMNGANSSTYAKGGVIGECAGPSCDGAVVAVLSDGDFANTAATPRAMFTVDYNTGSATGSKADFGLDLLGPGQHGSFDAVTYGKADIYLPAKVCWPIRSVGAPTNGLTGTGNGTCGTGSLLVDTTASVGMLYINTGTLASPTWTKVGTQT